MVHALFLKFREVQQAQGEANIGRDTVDFHSLKELAKR